MPALTTEQVLIEEAIAIHGQEKVKKLLSEEKIKKIQRGDLLNSPLKKELYQTLNALNSSALCLSGGGIRSATFALGVMQALATHPRPVRQDQVQKDKLVGGRSNRCWPPFSISRPYRAVVTSEVGCRRGSPMCIAAARPPGTQFGKPSSELGKIPTRSPSRFRGYEDTAIFSRRSSASPQRTLRRRLFSACGILF